MEEDLSDPSSSHVHLGCRLQVLCFPAVFTPSFEYAIVDLPDEDCLYYQLSRSPSEYKAALFPSSPPDAKSPSSNGDQAVSKTGAVCPLASGIKSGNLIWKSLICGAVKGE